MQSANGYPQRYHTLQSSIQFQQYVKTTLNILIYNNAVGNSKVKCFDII